MDVAVLRILVSVGDFEGDYVLRQREVRPTNQLMKIACEQGRYA